MDVRLGISQSAKELVVELADDADPATVRADVDAVLADDDSVLWLTDRRGRQVGVASSKIAYVEIASDDPAHRVGFGG